MLHGERLTQTLIRSTCMKLGKKLKKRVTLNDLIPSIKIGNIEVRAFAVKPRYCQIAAKQLDVATRLPL